jgi:hypothetical protein
MNNSETDISPPGSLPTNVYVAADTEGRPLSQRREPVWMPVTYDIWNVPGLTTAKLSGQQPHSSLKTLGIIPKQFLKNWGN